MENENKNKKNGEGPKKLNFNSYWIYGIIILVLIAIQMITSMSITTQTISQGRFEQIAKSGDIDKVEVVNKAIANIYLKKDVITPEKYPKLKTGKLSDLHPHFKYEIGDMSYFYDRITALKKEGINIDPVSISKTNWYAPLIGWILPFLLLIGLWLFIMKRMSGGPRRSGRSDIQYWKIKSYFI